MRWRVGRRPAALRRATVAPLSGRSSLAMGRFT